MLPLPAAACAAGAISASEVPIVGMSARAFIAISFRVLDRPDWCDRWRKETPERQSAGADAAKRR
jgi:hypothetical protein